MAKPMGDLSTRFWSKVDRSGECWLWTASLNNKGYGRLQVCEDGIWKVKYATRTAWLLATGKWPTAFMCHKCDTPACVRFDHLFEGTQAENMKDAQDKGRLRGRRLHQTRCKRGHSLFGSNMYLQYGKRHCRTCRRECKRKRRLELRQLHQQVFGTNRGISLL